MKVLKELEILRHQSTGAKKDVCQYLLEFKGNYLDLKSEKIAAQFHTSTALCTRIAKEIGLNGFGELKFLLDMEKNEKLVLNQTKTAGIELYFEELIRNFRESLTTIDITKIKEVAQKIFKAKRIVIIYDAQNYLYAEMLRQLFQEEDLDFRLCDSYVYAKKQIGFCTKDDYIIILKFNNDYRNYNRLIKYVSQQKLNNCIITNHKIATTDLTTCIDIAQTTQFGIGRRLLITTIFDMIFNEYQKE